MISAIAIVFGQAPAIIGDVIEIFLVIENMFDSMYEAEGIGLAANQVGLNMNLFIIDVTQTDEAEEKIKDVRRKSAGITAGRATVEDTP